MNLCSHVRQSPWGVIDLGVVTNWRSVFSKVLRPFLGYGENPFVKACLAGLSLYGVENIGSIRHVESAVSAPPAQLRRLVLHADCTPPSSFLVNAQRECQGIDDVVCMI